MTLSSSRSRRPAPVRAAGLLLAIGLTTGVVGAACSSDPGSGSGSDGTTTTGGPAGLPGVEARLAEIADDVVVPAYEGLAGKIDGLATAIDDLCTTPADEALVQARDAWRVTYASWQFARPGNVGPAMDRRLMSAVGFEARPKSIAKLLEGDEPIDPASLAGEGAPVRGLLAAEEALFGDGSDDLATPDGARRCTYVTSVVDLVGTAVDEVVADWHDGYRDEFVAGPDGDPMASVAVIMNQLTHRLQELDDRGLRDLAAGGDYDDLKDARKDGPAAFGMAGRRALLAGLAALVGEPGTRVAGLVGERNADTGERLVTLTSEAEGSVSALPDSMRETFDDNAAVVAADDALAALKVLVSTEAASQLGVTITFSDSDGDG